MEELSSIVDMGFDSSMAGAAGLSVLLSKYVIYPLIQWRRRAADAAGQPTSGEFFIPENLQGAAVLLVNAALAAGLAVAAGVPVFPAISTASTGLILARVVHEVSRPKTE